MHLRKNVWDESGVVTAPSRFSSFLFSSFLFQLFFSPLSLSPVATLSSPPRPLLSSSRACSGSRRPVEIDYDALPRSNIRSAFCEKRRGGVTWDGCGSFLGFSRVFQLKRGRRRWASINHGKIRRAFRRSNFKCNLPRRRIDGTDRRRHVH